MPLDPDFDPASPEDRPQHVDPQTLEPLLYATGRACSAAAAQGLLTGSLVADPGQSGASLMPVLGAADPDSLEHEQALAQAVQALRLQVLRALNDPGLGFALPLPDDGEDLSERSRALGEWVEGFLGGLGQTRRLGGLKPSPEATEILRDFAEIARIEAEVRGDEDDEQAFAELCEYVRMGVMLLSDELNPPPPPNAPIALQ